MAGKIMILPSMILPASGSHKSAQRNLAAAEDIIKKCGYHRRDEELADAKRAILG
jgi:hypothetical protein